MTALTSMEQVFNRVQLVRGKGERQKGRLCIMSFVALLAGERHTDAPATASPFIRHFAIALNDAMSEANRQRLKLFAPRIVGTNDGLDAERVRVVRTVFADEVIPQLRTDLASDWLPQQLGSDWATYAAGAERSPQEFFFSFVGNTCRPSAGRETNKVAVVAAKLLITCAQSAPPDADGGWYWSKAIDLLDRLCDVEPTRRRSSVGSDQVARVAYILDHTKSIDAITLLAGDMLSRMRRRFRGGAPNSTLSGSLAGRTAIDGPACTLADSDTSPGPVSKAKSVPTVN